MTGVQTCALPISEQKTPLTALRGVGGKVAERFSSLGVESIEDLIFLFPRAYQDRRNPKSIASLRSGETTTVRAQVLSVSERRYRRTAALEMMVSDGSGLLVLKWFRYGRWLRKNLEKKDRKSTRLNSSHIPLSRMPSSA